METFKHTEEIPQVKTVNPSFLSVDSKPKNESLQAESDDINLDLAEVIEPSNIMRSEGSVKETQVALDRVRKKLGIPSVEGDSTMDAESFKENLGYVVSEEEIQTLSSERIAPYFLEKLGIPAEKLDQFEDEFSKDSLRDPYKYGTSDAVEYRNYQGLRYMDLSKLEIERLVKAAVGGKEGISQELSLSLKGEREHILSLLENPDIKQKVSRVFNEIGVLYQEAGVRIPRSELPTTQFIGKFDQIFLQAKRGQEPGISIGKGEYIPEFDACIVQLNPPLESEISDVDITIAVHENFHSLSAKTICNGDGGDVNWFDAIKGKSGFFSKNRGNERRPHSLLALNEGLTELLARVTGARVGIDIKQIGSYNNYVKDALVLAQVLNGEAVNEMLPYEQVPPVLLKSLLEKYGSDSGTLSLGREMDRIIGSNALSLYDVLSYSENGGGFAAFAKSLQSINKGLPAEDVPIDRESLQRYGLEFEDLRKEYTFLVEKAKTEQRINEF